MGETAKQQQGLSSIPPYLEELVEEEGEPVSQHLLSHRLGPREARRTRTLHTKPNHASEAPNLPWHSSCGALNRGCGPGAGRQQDAASAVPPAAAPS